MKGISKQVEAMLAEQVKAQMAAVSAPYRALANTLAAELVEVGTLATGVKEKRGGVWAGFKRAATIAQEAGHNSSTMRAGLEIACNDAGIPSGTFRGYVSTLEKLKADVDDGSLTMADLTAISIADARKRYKEPPTEKDQAVAALNKAVEKWTPEQVRLLVEYAETIGQSFSEELVGLGVAEAKAA